MPSSSKSLQKIFVAGDQMRRSHVHHDEGKVATREASDGFGQNKNLVRHRDTSDNYLLTMESQDGHFSWSGATS